MQFSPHLGDVEKNLAIHLDYLEKARQAGANLVIFPELSLTGYNLKDMVEEVAIDPESSPYFKKLLAGTDNISVVVGLVEEKPSEKGIFYNSAAFLDNKKILHIHRKVYLPTGGLFEERRFFAAGRVFKPFQTAFGRAGLLICRDFLHLASAYVHFVGGADFIIVISAAPGRGVSGGDSFETSRMWELMGEAAAYFTTTFVIYVNRVGIEDGVTFGGGSFIFGPGGELFTKADYLEPAFILQELDLGIIRQARKMWLFKRDERPEAILRSLERVIYGYLED